MAGLLLIAILAIRGWKKGFIDTLGGMLAGLLAVVFVYLLHSWALDSLLITLLTDRMLVLVRIVLCAVLFVVTYLILKTIILSLRIITGIPVIRGLNRLLGFLMGAVYGVLMVGIIFAFFI